MDEKYLIINHDNNTFEFCHDKEEAAKIALSKVNFEGEEAVIYLVKPIGIAYIPDSPATIDWMED